MDACGQALPAILLRRLMWPETFPKSPLKTGIFGYRGLDDCAAILEYVKQSKKVVTIGGCDGQLHKKPLLFPRPCHATHHRSILWFLNRTSSGRLLPS
jgi:hypothetical protein